MAITPKPSALIIDGDSDLAQIVGTFLSCTGYRVIHTRRTREAIKKLTLQKFAFILLDPKSDSKAEDIFAALLEKDSLNFRTPVIISTMDQGLAIQPDALVNLRAVLKKPYHLADLNGCLPQTT